MNTITISQPIVLPPIKYILKGLFKDVPDNRTIENDPVMEAALSLHQLSNPYPKRDHRRTASFDQPSFFQPKRARAHTTSGYPPSVLLTKSETNHRYHCLHCKKSFSRPSSLRIHIYSHTGEKPFKCQYTGCGRCFNVQSNMRRHLRVHSQTTKDQPTSQIQKNSMRLPIMPSP